jgi:hypothetical protein
MSPNKYDKHLTPAPLVEGKFAPVVRFSALKHFNQNMNLTVVRNCISGPFLMDKGSHAHDFDQFLFFLGANPMNVEEFMAEVHFSLGEEEEKHIITSSTVAFIPRGMKHCPLNFVRVDKPIYFINMALTPEYTRVNEPGKEEKK